MYVCMNSRFLMKFERTKKEKSNIDTLYTLYSKEYFIDCYSSRFL